MRRRNGSDPVGALAVAAGALAVVAGSAGAFAGGPGSGPIPRTNAPDLMSATVTRLVDASDAAGPQVRLCFDAAVATVVFPDGLVVQDYDSARGDSAVSAVVDPVEPNCVTATFADGRDLEQGSAAVAGTGAVQASGGLGNPVGSVPLQPLQGTTAQLAPVAGRTTGPDLVDAEVTGQKEVTYTFDERIDPTPGVAYNAGQFGYYIDSQDGAAPTTGNGPVVISRNRAIVSFADPITSAKQFVVAEAAVQDVDSDVGANTQAPIGSAGTQITGSPGLVSAARESDGQSIDLTFSQAVTPGFAGGVVAYREDGAPIAADSITTTGDAENQVLRATFPASLQKDPASVVKVAVRAIAATARSGTNGVAYTVASVGTCRCKAGYTDGPDLLTTVIHDDLDTVEFHFDEPVEDTPTPAVASFTLLQPDSTTIPGQDGVARSADRTTVTVHFGSSVSATVGVANQLGAVADEVPQHNGSPVGTAGVGIIDPCPPFCVSGTSPTPTPTPSPTPTVTAHPPLVVRAKLKVLRHRGRAVTGRIAAAYPCAAGRIVRLVRSGRRIATARSRPDGAFRLASRKARHARRGRLIVQVPSRTVVTTICASTSKRL